MTTKPSNGPWADEPFKLIPTPSTYKDIKSHAAVNTASGMAYSHNCLLRGLNAIMQQGPHIVSKGQPGYTEQDVIDFCFYVESWCKTVNHHHHTEETVIFPGIEKMAGEPGLLSGPTHQHEEFHDGMIELENTSNGWQKAPQEYSWTKTKTIIDGFAPALTKHLYEEIDVFLSFEGRIDSDGLQKCWDEGEAAAKAAGKISFLYDIFPCVLGTCDKTYEGGNDFPPLPGFMPYAIKYWFGSYNSGAWRFNPCDFWGQPRPLPMLPENRLKV